MPRSPAPRLVPWLATLCLLPAGSQAAPGIDGAVEALVSGPLDAAGDLAGGAGMILAAGGAGAGDLVGLMDRSRWAGWLLRGAGSSALHRLALALSWTSTGILEGLRDEDIERLPEPPAAYLEAAPGAGRLTAMINGVEVLGLALGDALATPPLAILRLAGAGRAAGWIAQQRQDARTFALGPLAPD